MSHLISREKKSCLEAAIAATITSGMDENSPEVTTLKGSLVKAKRNAQEAPTAVQVKGAQEFVDRAQKRLDARDKLRRELEIELAEGQARLQRLRKQVEEEAKSPPAVPEPPPEWVSEIHRLRSEVARFKASANRPVRDSVEAAMSIRAKAEKRRAGGDGQHPCRRTKSLGVDGGEEFEDARRSGMQTMRRQLFRWGP